MMANASASAIFGTGTGSAFNTTPTTTHMHGNPVTGGVGGLGSVAGPSSVHMPMPHHMNGADLGPPPPIDDDEGMIPVQDAEMRDQYDDLLDVVGPKLVPITPIMRYAMRDVVTEYEDDQSISEYASLSDVDEY